MENSSGNAGSGVLIGNSFPWSLVARPIHVKPGTEFALRENLAGAAFISSFWGHESTMMAASALAGTDLTPRCLRPALTLNSEGLPTLDGIAYREVWLISPCYRHAGFRPAQGSVVAAEDIERWQVLQLVWE